MTHDREGFGQANPSYIPGIRLFTLVSGQFKAGLRAQHVRSRELGVEAEVMPEFEVESVDDDLGQEAVPRADSGGFYSFQSRSLGRPRARLGE